MTPGSSEAFRLPVHGVWVSRTEASVTPNGSDAVRMDRVAATMSTTQPGLLTSLKLRPAMHSTQWSFLVSACSTTCQGCHRAPSCVNAATIGASSPSRRNLMNSPAWFPSSDSGSGTTLFPLEFLDGNGLETNPDR